MKKLFAGLLVLLALVLASSPAMALVYEIYCQVCQQSRDFEPTGRYIAAPGDLTHLQIYKCPVCGNEQGTGYILDHEESKAATCISQAYCDLCHKYFGDKDPDNHAYTIVYNKVDEVNHIKEEACSRCKKINYSLTEKHTPKEAATCMSAAICASCNEAYGSPNPDAHNWSDWLPNQFNSNLHYRYCMNIGCRASESESHDGNSNCATSATCSKCQANYTDTTKHVGPFTYTYEKYDESFHKRIETCTACGNKTGNQVDTRHEESTPAECTHAAWCNVCNQAYGDPNPDNHGWGNWTYENENQHYRICSHNESHIQHADHRGYATCIESMPCLDCGLSYKDPDSHNLVQHDAQAPTCTEIGWDAYETCSRCDYTTYVEKSALDHDRVSHDAKAPTCTTIGWNAYETCSRCDYTTYAEKPALEHDYAAKTAKPTCTKKGYTTHTCTRCGESYRDAIVSALGHWYGEWTPNADGTNSASCLRDAYEHTVDCARFSFVLTAEDVRTEFVLCPVCGEVSDGTRLMLAEAAAKAVTGKLPAGEIVVRMGALESGEQLMSVAFEIGGKPTQPTGQVKITLPAEVLEGYALCLLSEDGAETELTLEGDEEEETISFTLDFTNSETPVQVIRLIPEV